MLIRLFENPPVLESVQFVGGTPEAIERAKLMGFDVGRPLYHGTTHDFRQFSLKGTTTDSHHGAGFYFSTSPEDVAKNYASRVGPDITTRVSFRAESLIYDLEHLIDSEEYETLAKLGISQEQVEHPEFDVEEAAKRIATRELMGSHEGATMPVYVRLNNPVIVNGGQVLPGGRRGPARHRSTFWEYVVEWDDTGDELVWDETGIGSYGGPAAKVVEAVEEVLHASDFGHAVAEVTGMIWEVIHSNEGISADQLENILRDEPACYVSEYGETSPGQVIQDVYRMLGHDGIILKNAEREFQMIMNPDTDHVVVFNANSIRSIFAKFNPDMAHSDDIMESELFEMPQRISPFTQRDGVLALSIPQSLHDKDKLPLVWENGPFPLYVSPYGVSTYYFADGPQLISIFDIEQSRGTPNRRRLGFVYVDPRYRKQRLTEAFLTYILTVGNIEGIEGDASNTHDTEMAMRSRSSRFHMYWENYATDQRIPYDPNDHESFYTGRNARNWFIVTELKKS